MKYSPMISPKKKGWPRRKARKPPMRKMRNFMAQPIRVENQSLEGAQVTPNAYPSG